MANQEIAGQKGYIVLTTGRSGSTWLNSITKPTGRMGVSSEWLGFENLEKPWKAYNAQSYYDYIMQNSSTPNGRFCIKIFPRHLRHSQACFNFDFIRKCAREHDVKFYLLTREDRLGQSISLLRARQSKAWVNKGENTPDISKHRMRYNFRRLSRIYFEIGQAYDFWRSYLGINAIQHEAFVYEDLLPDPTPFVESVAKHLCVPPPDTIETKLKIQRDDLTLEWRQRFMEDIKQKGVHPDSYNLPHPAPTLKNAFKVWRNRGVKSANGGF